MNYQMSPTLARILSEAQASGERVNYFFARQYSTLYLTLLIVDPLPKEPFPSQAYARLNIGERGIFFSYGYGDQTIDDGLGNKFRPTRAETSIESAYRLDPQTKFAIDRLVMAPGKLKIKYAASIDGAVDPVVRAAYEGILDSGTQLPPELHDPLGAILPGPTTIGTKTLHQAVFEAIRSACTLEFTLGAGGRQSRKLGPLSLFDNGGASSFLAAFGGFDSCYGYGLPEGILWDSENKPEGRVGFILRVERPVVIPLQLVSSLLPPAEQLAPMVPLMMSLPLTLFAEGQEVHIGDYFNQ